MTFKRETPSERFFRQYRALKFNRMKEVKKIAQQASLEVNQIQSRNIEKAKYGQSGLF